MGIKRPIQDEDLNEFPLKPSKQVNFGNELTSFSQNFHELEENPKIDNSGDDDDDMYFKIQYDDDSDASKDDSSSGHTYISPFSPEFVDFHFPRRLVPQFEDTYSLLLEGPPRKQVPIGADRQAVVPEWDPQAVVYAYDEKLTGECVLSPGSSDDVAFNDWKGCSCPDEGSIRCVQEHVKEAREALRAKLGNEKFEKLGFCDMGEDVAEKWSAEEEHFFHEIVYTRSVSNGRNFWHNLSSAFPSTKKSEIVSYYFNVFMLRRRSVQNRSSYLDIDSDADDWDESYEQEGEENINESPLPVDNDDVDKEGDVEKKGDEWNSGYVSCKGKAWDDFFVMSPLKFVDLPPMGNMMEEIFGPCSKNNGPI